MRIAPPVWGLNRTPAQRGGRPDGGSGAAGGAELYQKTLPLALEAYRELGYLDQPFGAIFVKAIDTLLRTPVVAGRIALNADSVNYTYVDRRLEVLPPAQKQLLRMGPQNARKVQNKLRELARAMKLPIDS